MDVIITCNSPGELATWCAPTIAYWRRECPDWRFFLALVPCPFASGREYEYAKTIDGLEDIWPPNVTARILWGGRLPISRVSRGIVIYLGGEPWHAWRLGQRWKYPCLGYAKRASSCWKYFSAVATADENLAQQITAWGVKAKNVGYVGQYLTLSHPKKGEGLTLGLFPGSRPALLRYTLPIFLFLAKRLLERVDRLNLLLCLSPFISRPILEDILAHPGICHLPRLNGKIDGDVLELDGGGSVDICWGKVREALEIIDGAVSIPGTNTGEIAASGKPLVVAVSDDVPIPRGGLGWFLEKIPGITRWRRKMRLLYYERLRFAAQPNYLAGEMVLPEVLVDERLDNLVETVVETMTSDEKRGRLGKRLSEIMGNPGINAEKLARFVVDNATSPTDML